MSDMNPTTKKSYKFLVTTAAFMASAIALLLFSLKLYAWFVTEASAMLASATDSLLDLFASLMSLIILRFALAPADAEHKFGHGKAESIAGLVQSAFVLGSAVLLMINGIDRIITPKQIVQTEVGIIVSIIAIVMTLLLVLVQRYVIKHTSSVAISADALHYQSDLLLNTGVLISLFLSQGYWLRADGIFTLLVGVYLLVGALKIVWLSVNHLMDHELDQADITIIEDIVNKHPQTKGLHDLRTRDSGNIRFIQFHLELDDELSLLKAHSIGESLEKEIEQVLSPCEVFIHHDPVSVVKTNTVKSITENQLTT